jgi:hypothetical protein
MAGKNRRDSLYRRQDTAKSKRKTGGGFRNNILNVDPDVDFIKIDREGVFNFDIMPYEVTIRNHPNGTPPGELDYNLEIWVHRFVGVNRDSHVLCLAKTFGQPCPLCEEQRSLKETGGDKKLIESLEPKRRALYNIIDLDDEDKGVQIWETSYYLLRGLARQGPQVLPVQEDRVPDKTRAVRGRILQ